MEGKISLATYDSKFNQRQEVAERGVEVYPLYRHTTQLADRFGWQHIESWERDNDELSDIAAPDRVPTDDMPREERMLYRDVPENAPKDWRRDIVKEYLRERHDIFLQERSTRVDDDSDEEMEDVDAIEKRFEAYMNRLRNS